MTSFPESSTFSFAGGRKVHRLGYGAMQLTGPGIWGPPRDHAEAVAVVRRAVEIGVDFIDTADSYGPYFSEEIIAEALRPYPEQVLVATKAGLVRTGPGEWHPVGRPEYLRQEVEMSLRRLGLDRIELFQLHRIDSQVPAEDQVGVLKDLQDEGKIGQIGLSEVSVDQIEAAGKVAEIVSVQNLYNLTNRQSEDVLDYCETRGIAFIPWFPIATGDLASPDSPVAAIATEVGATSSQVALAWLLQKSPVVLPIPGTKSVEHLTENLGAARLTLSEEDMTRLDALA
jgi:aryl-alcohol dehydrogenase-like predicted oxidoreductase